MITITCKNKSAEQLMLNELMKHKDIDVTLTEAKPDPRGGELLIADSGDLSDETVKDLKKIMKTLGLFVYEVPSSKATDTWALVFSKKQMSSTELKAFNIN